MAKIVGLGEILWDVFPDGAKLGGAPGNFAMHVNSLGEEGWVVSSIGKDELGIKAKEIFDSRGLKYNVEEVDTPTGTVVVTLDSHGKATYDFTKNSAWDNITLNTNAINLAKECDCVCFGSLGQRSKKSRDSIYRFLDSTRQNCIKIFDINIREKYYSLDIIMESLKRATVLKLNDEELPLLREMLNLPKSDEEAISEIKEKFNLDLVILTMGSNGSLLFRDKDNKSFVKPPKIDVVDTVGAGDSYTAAVAVGLLRGDSLDDINNKANKVAAYVCTQKGGTPKLNTFF
ncbi:MAG: carbohydrate kinase [Spirochaetales bacterium]|nr:carbohydrate kinase [Spirochaetales bacterium]